MATSPPLPDPIESELMRLLDGPDAEFWPGVARLCQQHPALTKPIQREAERMQAEAGGKRDGSTQAQTKATDDDADLRAGDRVGPFAVLDMIGHGGMGSVYLAEQKEPVRRRVALKVIKLGMDTKAVLARFEAERQALAMMDHSHIAKVLEAGVTPKGKPYFAMEYVKGVPITRYCDDAKLSLEDRLALFKQVCSGVQHAHTKGVIHRDLTPNNVLVTLQDGKPAAKIIDFGLARATDHKLTEKTLFTEQGVILGTPEYMSPEQAGLNALDIDMRSDVYTLGVLLYELLTGKLPFEAKELRAQGYDRMCKTIREAEPPRPSTKVTTTAGGTDAAAKLRRTDASTLLKRLRGDLDWIVLKCLEKDRTRRYETVSQLADDVERYLDSEPVLARAPSAAYRMAKFARRYRGQVVATAAVFVALAGGLGAAVYFWRDAVAQSTEAKKQAGIAETARAGEAEKAKEAAANAATAQHNAEEALERKRQFDQLAADVLYRRAVANESKLYPPWPQRIEAMERWLRDDAGKLLAMGPQIEKTVAELRASALPPTPDEVEHDRTSHPKFGEWQKQAAKLASLQTEVQAAAGEAGAKALDDLRASVAALEAEVSARQTYRFAEEAQGFLHDTLSELLGKLASLDAKERKAVDERLGWARRIAALTQGHPKASVTWEAAREAIAKADGVVASELYRGQTIELREQDVMGLVPIGMNPATKLWEFYELRSAWDGQSDPAAIQIPRHVAKGDDAGYIEVGAGTGIVFVLLPGGKFTMGSQGQDPNAPNYDPQHRDDEAMHEVTLTPFFLARHELTQGQWRRLSAGETPSQYEAGSGNFVGGQITWSNPVESVDWTMCDTLLVRHGLALPTEAQWEYGCRAGTTTPWTCDAAKLRAFANLADATAKGAGVTWTCEEWSDGHVVPAPVGGFLANAFGLFDVHGNVWEWTRDGDHGAGARPRSGDGLRGDPGSASIRVGRGGSFGSVSRFARSSGRGDLAPTLRSNSLGARPARASRLDD